MLQMQTFARDAIFPSWIANALGKALSVLASQFQLAQSDNTHVQVAAGPNGAAAVLSIAGLWRWIEATITVAHPGGAAGTYPIFATAQANNITNVPDPNTDQTNYAFSLVIKGPGQTPTIVPGSVDVFRQVGNAIWDGAKITRVDQLVPSTPMHAGRHAAGGGDPLTPAMISAAAAADLAAEIARAEAAEAALNFAATFASGDIAGSPGTSAPGGWSKMPLAGTGFDANHHYVAPATGYYHVDATMVGRIENSPQLFQVGIGVNTDAAPTDDGPPQLSPQITMAIPSGSFSGAGYSHLLHLTLGDTLTVFVLNGDQGANPAGNPVPVVAVECTIIRVA